jgi:hypothetical protein
VALSMAAVTAAGIEFAWIKCELVLEPGLAPL